MSEWRERSARALYRLFLQAYPRDFRGAYADAMTDDFLRLRRSARSAGTSRLAWLWMRTIVDLVGTGVGARVDARYRHMRTRTGRGGHMRDDLTQDLKHAFRTFRRSPGYAAIVVLTLGLGIGANTAMFSLVDGVLLSPLPYGQGDRIVHVRQTEPLIHEGDMPFSVQEIEDYRTRSHTLMDVVEYHNMSFTLLGMDEAKLVRTGVVSARFFDVLGMRPILGRSFTVEDDHLDADPVMILSYEYWTTQFGADPSVVGRGLVMNDKVHTVVGVLPPIPQYPDENDVYMPTSQCPTRSSDRFIANRAARMMTVFGVLRPRIELSAARQDLADVAAEIARENPQTYQLDTKGYGAEPTPLKEDLVVAARPTLLILMATTVLVLLIACANVASLALARSVRQGGELAVRQALGANRGRLVRQLLTESVVLSMLGGVLGVAVAGLTLDLLVKFAGRFSPRAFEASIDGRVLTFAALAALATGLFFGSVPALRRVAGGGASVVRARAEGGGREGRRAQASLVALQVALALDLLIAAGLLTRTFVAVSSVELGYRPEQVLSADVRLPMMKYYMGMDVGAADRFFDEAIRRIEGLPGVRAAALAQGVPLNGPLGRTGLEIEEAADVGPDRWVQILPTVVSAEYLDVLGVPILAGRGLTASDVTDSTDVVVLASVLARSLWGGRDPLDRRVRLCSFNSGSCEGWRTVVGIAGDVRMEGMEADASPAMYLPAEIGSWNGNTIIVRAEGDLATLGRQVGDIVHALEPDAPVSHPRTLVAAVDDAVAPRRLTAALMTVFAGLALAVTLAGVAGLVAFTISRRLRDFGIRLALGADPRTVVAGAVRHGLVPAIVGLGLGAAAAWALSGALTHLVWGVRPTDPITFMGASTALLAAVLVACWLPARRAANVDPVTTLRSD